MQFFRNISSSIRWSMLFHGILILAMAIFPLFPGCRKKLPPPPIDFTVVLEENLIEPNIPDEVEEEEEVEEETEEEIEPPKPPPPKAIPLPKKQVVQEKKKPVKKISKPKPKPKPKPTVKKTFKKGKRIERKKDEPKVDFTKLKKAKPFDASKPVSKKPVTDRKLSNADIRKALAAGARPGVRNQLPQGEENRCFLLIRNALFDAWEPPSADERIIQAPQLEIRLDRSGKIASYRIILSSGSKYYDQTVLKAAARTMPIRGLSSGFLKKYDVITIEFKIQ